MKSTPSERLQHARMKRINALNDQLAHVLRKPTAAPLATPAECISVALSMMVPGPADLISPNGRLVRLILLALDKVGFKIVAKEREDYGSRDQ